MIRKWFFKEEKDIWFSSEDNTGFSYQDRVGRMMESSYEDFQKGDMITVKIFDKDQNRRVHMIIGEQIFVRGKAVYSTKMFCPFHEVSKIKDDKNDEKYCPVCEK